MKPIRPILLLVALIFAPFSNLFAGATFFLSCAESNDLFRVLKQNGYRCERFDSASAAIKKAPVDSAVLILAERYPERTTQIEQDALKLAQTKNLKLYVEFPDPAAFPEFHFAEPQQAEWERGVIASDVFGKTLPPLRIVAVHGARFLPAQANQPWLVIARVAGFNDAVYGLPKNAMPLLFKIPGRDWFIATTKLSNFVSARYEPMGDWLVIWERVLAQLNPSKAPFQLRARATVAPAFGPDQKLPRHAERKAFVSAAEWILNSQLLVPASRTNEIISMLRTNGEAVPLPSLVERGDGSFGILEGYASGIQPDGSQLQRLPLRADCHAESAMVLAMNGQFSKDKKSRAVAENLLDFVYFKSGMCGGPRGEESHGAFGLVAWGDVSPAWLVANYGDDNARVILGTVGGAAALKNSKWDSVITKALLANFRTTGKLGFRGDRIDNPALANGWKPYFNAEPVNYSPHFESYLWACNLWAYRATGYELFLEKTANAIRMTMKAYPGGWRWQDNIERARMLLCLSWLVRVQDTPEHRQWLFTVANDLLKRQGPSGAIHEWLGGTGGGHYQIPLSNEAYGTGETPLIQTNGDPASDQLYTTGFALLGLHEAVGATGDAKLKQAEDKLAEFLCRIQMRSNEKPYLNGWWFRAFDDSRWDYWASSADAGWGAWSLESGWAQSWTATTLALRDQKTTFWEFTRDVSIKDDFENWEPRMMK